MKQAAYELEILHLSDLHFGPYLQGVANNGEWSRLAPTHSFNLLQGLESKVSDLLRNKEKLLVLVTGDMTTAAEPPAYEAVNNYLRDNPFVSDSLRVGLSLHEIRDRFFVVPGNHDIWLYGPWLTKWKRYTNRRQQYYKYFPEQFPIAHTLKVGETSVTIFAIDTNDLKGFNFLNFKNVLGKGEIGKDQIAALQTIHTRLQTGTYAGTPSGFNYQSSLKIVMMHHHLALPRCATNTLENKLLELKDASAGLNLFCEMGIHMVLCGHQHFPFLIPELNCDAQSNKKVFFSCAGSATQLNCNQNSFCVYRIHSEDGVYNLEYCLYSAKTETNSFSFRPSEPSSYRI